MAGSRQARDPHAARRHHLTVVHRLVRDIHPVAEDEHPPCFSRCKRFFVPRKAHLGRLEQLEAGYVIPVAVRQKNGSHPAFLDVQLFEAFLDPIDAAACVYGHVRPVAMDEVHVDMAVPDRVDAVDDQSCRDRGEPPYFGAQFRAVTGPNNDEKTDHTAQDDKQWHFFTSRIGCHP